MTTPTTGLQQLLDQFGAYWEERVRAGSSSGFSRTEWLAVEIFAQWMLVRGVTASPTAKTVSKELEVVCDCGNRDSITAPITAAPMCSAGCGRRMTITGALAL